MYPATYQNGGDVKGYLKTSEVAKRFDVDPRTIIRWVREGNFPGSIKKNPSARNSPILIPEEAVEKFSLRQADPSKWSTGSDGNN